MSDLRLPRIDVLIPLYRRRHHIARVIASVYDSSKWERIWPVFILTEDDAAVRWDIAEHRQLFHVLPGPRQPGDFARKINLGAQESDADWVFMGADDLAFHHGWAEKALAVAAKTGARCIGTNDLGNPRSKAGQTSTHTLVHRSYLADGTIDERGKLLHEGYSHNFVDDEFVATARRRGEFAMALGSNVEHLHPDWGKGIRDEVYELGVKDFAADRRLWNQRRRLI